MPLGVKSTNFVTELEISRYYAQKDLLNNSLWFENWSWLVDEYKMCNKDLTRFEKTTGEAVDSRTSKPIPLTTNGFYGWIATKSEFNYKNFNPDVFKAQPLPDVYKLIH